MRAGEIVPLRVALDQEAERARDQRGDEQRAPDGRPARRLEVAGDRRDDEAEEPADAELDRHQRADVVARAPPASVTRMWTANAQAHRNTSAVARAADARRPRPDSSSRPSADTPAAAHAARPDRQAEQQQRRTAASAPRTGR